MVFRCCCWTLLLCITGLPLTFSLAFQRPLRARTSTFAQYSSNLQDSTAAIPTDLILSSGYCAFARHCGVLAAIEDFNISIDRCVGTSSGSIAASLLCSGQFTPAQIENELRSRRPISLCQPSLRLNRGAFSLRGLIAHLRTLLPKDFNQLPRKLAVGQCCKPTVILQSMLTTTHSQIQHISQQPNPYFRPPHSNHKHF